MTKNVCVQIRVSDKFAGQEFFGIVPEFWEYDFAKPVAMHAIDLLLHAWNCESNIEDCGFEVQIVSEEDLVISMSMRSDSKEFLDTAYDELKDFVRSQ